MNQIPATILADPGWSASQRHTLVLLLAAFAVAAVAASLWPSRRSWLLVVLATALAVACLILWRHAAGGVD